MVNNSFNGKLSANSYVSWFLLSSKVVITPIYRHPCVPLLFTTLSTPECSLLDSTCTKLSDQQYKEKKVSTAYWYDLELLIAG